MEYVETSGVMAAPEGVRITAVTKNNVHRVLDFRNGGVAESHNRYLWMGKVGVLAWVNERVVGHAWATIGGDEHQTVNGYFQLRRNQVLIHDCHVDPGCRGRGIFPAMLGDLCAHVRLEGEPPRILADAARSNVASQRGLVKAGFTEAGFGKYLQVGGQLVYRKQCIWRDGGSFAAQAATQSGVQCADGLSER